MISRAVDSWGLFYFRNRFLLGFLSAGLVVLSACSVDQTQITSADPPALPTATSPGPTQAEAPPTLETGQETPTLDPEPTVAEFSQDIQYQMDLKLDYYNHWVEVDQIIILPHPSQEQVDEIVLVVPPNAWLNTFFLHSLTLNNETISGYHLDGVKLSIPLEEPWTPGEPHTLSISFRLELPIQNAREGYGPSPFGYTALQTNLVDWHPLVPPYEEGSGWIIHDPWLFGEYLVYPAADFQIRLEILNSPNLIVAASSEPIDSGDIRSYALDQARNFVFSVSSEYLVLEDEVNGTRVYGYVFLPYQIPGEAAFETTKQALDLYNDLFGPYQQDSITMVQADFNHGMEYEGLYFLSKGFFDIYSGSVESYLVTIAAHETAHQWWYGQVANDQALEPWLDEALCTFSELLFFEELYPDSVDWWWAVRVNHYQPSGAINRSIYGFREYTDQYLAYRNATYLQGAKFMNSLRNLMGNEDFIDFIQVYAEEQRDQVSSEMAFFSTLERYIDVDDQEWLREFFPPED
jgi:hypothetical protein